MAKKCSIDAVNQLGYDEFIEQFKNIVEHGTLVSGAVWSYSPFNSLSHLHQCFCHFMDSLPENGKQSILRCHPNLAGKLARQGKLTSESTEEQARAGLTSLSDEQFNEINQFNEVYRKKFCFPFVICARENKVAAIISGLRSRVQNSAGVELMTGIEEVKKISYYRLLDLVEDDNSSQPKL